jgi:hypothetical protein
MRLRTLLGATFALVSVLAVVSATAATISGQKTISSKNHSPAQVQTWCTGKFAEVGKGIYGCFTKHRRSIACGGPTKALQATCNVWGGLFLPAGTTASEEPVSSCPLGCVAYWDAYGVRRCRCR